MSEELELREATRLIDELVGLEHFDVIPLPSSNPKNRLYGARANRSMTIGYPPIAVADKRGVRLLDHKEWADAWIYAAEHGLEPPKRSQA